MSDPFFDADAHNPDHWRYWGRKRFDAAVEEVASEWRGTPMAEGKTNGDVYDEAIRRLKAAKWPPKPPEASGT